jgi:hypothetical protein
MEKHKTIKQIVIDSEFTINKVERALLEHEDYYRPFLLENRPIRECAAWVTLNWAKKLDRMNVYERNNIHLW